MNAFGLALILFLKGIEYDYCLNDLDAERVIFQEEIKPVPVTGRSIVFTLLIFSYKFIQNSSRVFIVSSIRPPDMNTVLLLPPSYYFPEFSRRNHCLGKTKAVLESISDRPARSSEIPCKLKVLIAG